MAGKFEYQKKNDVNVCKQETSLYLSYLKYFQYPFFLWSMIYNLISIYFLRLAGQASVDLLSKSPPFPGLGGGDLHWMVHDVTGS